MPSVDITAGQPTFSLPKGKIEKGFASPFRAARMRRDHREPGVSPFFKGRVEKRDSYPRLLILGNPYV